MSSTAPVVETVSRKRVIPAEELKNERTQPELWEFLEKNAHTPQIWDGMTLYILREDPKPSLYGGTNTLEKCPGYILMPDGSKQLLNSREDIELAIKQKYGGKAFRLILKKTNGERICEGKCINEAQPRYPDANPLPLPNAPQQNDASVAAKAMDIVGNQQPEALRLAMDVLRSASEIVMKSAGPPAGAQPASLDSELDRAFKAAMIKKLMDPPPDPLETFLRIKQVLGDGGGAPRENPLIDKLLNAAVDRFMNPVTAATGRTTLLDLGREFIPVLGTTVRETMHEYRLSVEAQARIAELQRSAPAPPPVQVVTRVIDSPQSAPAAAANPAPAETAAAPPPTEQLSFPQIAAHIAKIIKNVEYPVDEAVDRVLSFLYDTDGRLVGALLDPPTLDPRLKPGKEGLLQLFQHEPALNGCMVNIPRVSEFIDKFIVSAKEAEEAEARLRAAAPGANAAAAPPAPQPAGTPIP